LHRSGVLPAHTCISRNLYESAIRVGIPFQRPCIVIYSCKHMPKARDRVSHVFSDGAALNVLYDSGFVDVKSLEYAGLTKDTDKDRL
jgi:hypothetical protein